MYFHYRLPVAGHPFAEYPVYGAIRCIFHYSTKLVVVFNRMK
jgi:hypothetical protein